jgi:hypothetical protein
MLSWIIQNTIISIIIIFLVHYLFNFFKTTLTVPKIKDLVNTPNKKYENMFNVISKKNTDNNNNNSYTDNNNNSYTDIDLLPNLDTSDTDTITNINTSINSKNINSDLMKNELKNFLKKQLKESNSSIEIESNSSINNFATNSNTYSEY